MLELMIILMADSMMVDTTRMDSLRFLDSIQVAKQAQEIQIQQINLISEMDSLKEKIKAKLRKK